MIRHWLLYLSLLLCLLIAPVSASTLYMQGTVGEPDNTYYYDPNTGGYVYYDPNGGGGYYYDGNGDSGIAFPGDLFDFGGGIYLGHGWHHGFHGHHGGIHGHGFHGGGFHGHGGGFHGGGFHGGGHHR